MCSLHAWSPIPTIMRWPPGQCSWTTTLGHIEPELYNIIYSKRLFRQFHGTTRTTECHLSSHTILRSVVYPPSLVSTGQPHKNTQNCAKSSKNDPSWHSGNPKVLVRADIFPRSAYNGQCQKCDSRRCMTCKNIQCTQKT